MWCPECNTDRDGEITICPDCGAQLRELPKPEWGSVSYAQLTEKWPVRDGGEMVPPAFLTHRTTVSMEDELLCNMLSAYGIPSLKRFPNDGEFGRVIMGMGASGADIYVPETMLEDAALLIKGAEYDNDDIS